MKASIRIIKRRARFALGEAMGTAILGVICEFGISLGGAYLASSLFAGSDTFSIVLSQAFAFIVSLITSVFSAGLSYMYLNIARKEKYGVGDLLYFFKNHPDRVIVASFFLSVIQLVVMIPYYYYQFSGVVGETLEDQAGYLMNTAMFLLIGQVLYLVVTIPFAMTYYLMADQKEIGGVEALKKSAKMMRGAKGKFFLLLLSFAPMIVICALLFYVPLLWVLPHLFMCEACFYEILKNPEMDHADEAWPRQAPVDYVNPFLTVKADEEGWIQGSSTVLPEVKPEAENVAGEEEMTEETKEEIEETQESRSEEEAGEDLEGVVGDLQK
ncbi:MAG: DUF975 family protein [Blautia sp.]|nr:DUF975 family protein [Blautia sp.]